MCDASSIVPNMQLRDPRMYPNQFTHKSLRVREAINAWGLIPTRNPDLQIFHSELRTDKSALLSNGWPAMLIHEGWGAIVFAILPTSQRTFLGATWGPMTVNEVSPYHLGAQRPIIPMAELAAITVALRMLRAVQC